MIDPSGSESATTPQNSPAIHSRIPWSYALQNFKSIYSLYSENYSEVVTAFRKPKILELRGVEFTAKEIVGKRELTPEQKRLQEAREKGEQYAREVFG